MKEEKGLKKKLQLSNKRKEFVGGEKREDEEREWERRSKLVNKKKGKKN